MFPLIIVIRILFAASMVFVIGYIFGNFSRRKTLSIISRIAAILIIVLFFATSGMLMRSNWHRGYYHHNNHWYEVQRDSTER